MNTNNRIIFNTVVLYAKMAITIVISLYSLRLVLDALGEVDYGLQNVIMGVVSMLSFLNAALSVSTQRYLSYYQGKGNTSELTNIFNHSLFLHVLLGLVIVIVLESIGDAVLNNILTIPDNRLVTATTVYHIVGLSVFFTFITVPFTASINSNEKMEFVAIISIVESLAKLILAIFLGYTSYDRLLVYGTGLGGITVFVFICYYIICRLRFEECKHIVEFKLNIGTIRELAKFVSWNLIGSITALSKNHGISILFNIFNGPAVNAAYGVANQVSSQLNFFSVTMLRSLNPQIMKSEGAGDRNRMLYLSTQGCKYSFLLLALFAIPCISEMNTILGLWLKSVPQYTVIFCDIVLVAMMFDQLTVGINSAFQACNYVKQSAIYVGAVKLLILPVGFLLLKMGITLYSVVFLYALVELLAGCVRLFLAKKYMGYSIKTYVKDVCVKVLYPTISTIIICMAVHLISEDIIRLALTLLLCPLVFVSLAYYFSLYKDEKTVVISLYNKIRNKCFH